MHLDKFMHPRNKYKVHPNFRELGKLYPEFGLHIKTSLSGKLTINFKSEDSLRALAKVLLKHDFGLDVEIPPEKLVPTIPLRLNYILWLEDLMQFMKIDDVHGIDIGTGAVCVFPLLCAKMFNWKMLASEIDETSIKAANENVQRNNLNELIHVISVSEKSILKDLLKDDDKKYSFTMCNPPFFDLKYYDKVEKSKPPRNAETGNDNELSTDGGEKSFVLQMIDESLQFKNRVMVYTTMLGRKSSLKFCLAEFKKRNIDNLARTEFCQGAVKRWGLAWTFLPKEQVNLNNAPVITSKPSVTKKSNDSAIVFPFGDQFGDIFAVVANLKDWASQLQIDLKELKVDEEDLGGFTFELKCFEDTWSHARRKRRMASQEQPETKKIKLESDDKSNNISLEATTSNSKKVFLNCLLIIQKISKENDNDKDKCRVSIIFNDGTGGKLAVETFKQFLINKFNIRDYFQKQCKQSQKPKKHKKRKKEKKDDC